MIKPNELRIGNWIAVNGSTLPFKVSSISENKIEIYDNGANHPFNINSISHVPLTEDWLLKFGFEKFDANSGLTIGDRKFEDWQYYHNEHYYHFDNGELFLDSGNDEGWYVKKRIDFVHELQNLHFALTGTELTLKNNG